MMKSNWIAIAVIPFVLCINTYGLAQRNGMALGQFSSNYRWYYKPHVAARLRQDREITKQNGCI